MPKELRPYQQEAFNALRARLKEVSYPLLVDASVGAGKSLIIAELLLLLERAGWRSLCLTMNSNLIKQNAETYIAQGGKAGIFCQALREKSTTELTIFASPNSVHNAIKLDRDLSKVKFNLIVIDECHNINPCDADTMYMRILNHFGNMALDEKYKFRVVGLTGTPYRGKAVSIVGQNQFFKEKVCSISAAWLIENKYLTKPVFGYHKVSSIDFSGVVMNGDGIFAEQSLKKITDANLRLTRKIMFEVAEIMEANNRKGAFIFAATKRHCDECFNALPKHQAAIITGNTDAMERLTLLDKARKGEIKYLINVNVLITGIDVPNFDTVVFVRPTESLNLYTQAIGRALRLSEGKETALILDYAGNLDRHGDIDDPIINEALRPKIEEEKDYVIGCYCCNTMNKDTARRCIGVINNKRCDHYFDFKSCEECETKNDITAKYCRGCDAELIDPNDALTELAASKENVTFQIKKTTYIVTKHGEVPIFNIKYFLHKEPYVINETFFLKSEKAKRFFYYAFAKHFAQIENPSIAKIMNIGFLKGNKFGSPIAIECIKNDKKSWKVLKRIKQECGLLETQNTHKTSQ